MKAVIICPTDRSEIAFLARKYPLALTPILGRSLLDLTLADLAQRGAKEIQILAADRPEAIRAAVGRGEAWGLRIEVIPESRELSVDAARAKYRPKTALGWLPAPDDVLLLDHSPSQPAIPLLTTYRSWFEYLYQQIGVAARHRLGMQEVAPGVFLGLRSRVASTARLVAPCWIGDHVWVGAGTVIGPGGIVESGSFIDEGAEVVASCVGPNTYVGVLTELRNSLVWGRGLLNWENGSFTEVQDEILLADLGSRTRVRWKGSWFGRLGALGALILTSPILFLSLVRRSAGEPLFSRRSAVRTPWESLEVGFPHVVPYHELNGVGGVLRRWPELWKIARGEFNWVGNRPLTPEQANQLTGEFEQLWLTVPSGLISLADVEGCRAFLGDEARAHASFYAIKPSRFGDTRLLGRMIARAFSRVS